VAALKRRRALRASLIAALVLCLASSAAVALTGGGATATLELASGVLLTRGDYDLVKHGGDFNGDGLNDLVLGNENSLWVLYGGRRPGRVTLRALGRRGFAIDGRSGLTDYTNETDAAVVDDVNGDGRADVAVGLPEDSPGGRSRAGSVAVIYGQRGRGSIDVRKPLGNRGFRIIGPNGESSPNAGDASVLTYDYPPFQLGDVNGDGLADIGVSVGGQPAGGAIWIVFGSRDNADVDLAHPGTRAIRITPGPVDVAAAGDLNGDGIGDIVFGYPDWNRNKGAAYVLFGARGLKPFDFFQTRLGHRGFRVLGHSQDGAGTACSDETGCDLTQGDNGNQVGSAVGAAGDVNRDGIGDLIVGAPGVNFAGVDSGSAYVIYGRHKPSDVEISRLGRRGFQIGGAFPEENFGGSVGGGEHELFLASGAGDLNGDKRADLLFLTSDDPELPPERAYAVLSPRVGRTLAIARLGANGYRVVPSLKRTDRGSWVGPVSSVGDFNGDGRADVVVDGQARRGTRPGVYLFTLARRAAP
jgi:hypothetical protein